MRNDNNTLSNFLKARNPAIYALTYEEQDLVTEVCQFARKNAEDKNRTVPDVYVYTRPTGLYKVDLQDPTGYDVTNVIEDVKNYNELFQFIRRAQYNTSNDLNTIVGRLQETGTIENKNSSCIFILKDLHLFMNTDKDIIRYLRDLKENYRAPNYCPIIVTAPVLELPPELEKLFSLYEMPLMTTKEIESKLPSMLNGINITKQEVHDIAVAATGLTKREIFRAIAYSIVKNNKQTVKAEDIHAEKVNIVKKSGLLDFVTPKLTVSELGGCDNFKEWMKKVKSSLTPEAKAFGIPACKGAMLVGIPGTSKTASAEILANYLKVPLLKLDLSKILGNYVGQSEKNIARALAIVKSISPCVLLVDEADKGFSGSVGAQSGSCDAGTMNRVTGIMLDFLNDADNSVVTIMTSNDPTGSTLPVEFTRTGRLDAQWLFDLPTASERKEIIKIYVNKANLTFSDEVMDYMVKNSENFTGAEIKSAVKNILLNVYNRQLEAGSESINREATVDDIQNALDNTVTVYRSSKERIDQFRSVSSGRFLNASKPEQEPAKTTVTTFKNFSPGTKTVNFNSFKKGH